MAASSVDLPAPTAASAPDVRGIHQLRRQLEDWLSSRGVNQWSAGQLSENSIRNQVASDLWRVAKTDDGEIIGAFRIQDQDPSFWPENPADSVFLHALMWIDHGQAADSARTSWSSRLMKLGRPAPSGYDWTARPRTNNCARTTGGSVSRKSETRTWTDCSP